MEDSLYREILLENWRHPQNYGVVASADFDLRGSNILCGDRIRLSGKVANNSVTDIAFTAEGCAVCKAAASLFTEFVKGMTVLKIKALTETEVLTELGFTLTPIRTKCALLAFTVLQRAVK